MSSEKAEKRRSLAPMTSSYPKSPASKTEEKKAENVQVVVRCRYSTFLLNPFFCLTYRPLSQQETKDKVPVICKVEEKRREVSVQMKASNQSKTFAFDAAYGPTSTQQEIFEVFLDLIIFRTLF